MSTLVLIPARLGASRLPNKPLALLNQKPLLQHVIQRALRSKIGPVVVAVDSPELVDCAQEVGVQAILTDPTLPSGSDRIFQALEIFDPKETFQNIVNLQGDMAIFPEEKLKALLEPRHTFDITTLVMPLHPNDHDNPHCVKAVLKTSTLLSWHEAVYFSRAAIPYGAQVLWHHIGAYCFQRQALKRFVNLEPSPLEKIEKLEQLRALEGGLRIGIKTIESGNWLSIDTPQDLDKAEAWLASQTQTKASC